MLRRMAEAQLLGPYYKYYLCKARLS